jgi:hypothetical protein
MELTSERGGGSRMGGDGTQNSPGVSRCGFPRHGTVKPVTESQEGRILRSVVKGVNP